MDVGAAIGSILAFAVGVAISPVPIIAVILLLFSPRATVNSLAFLVGWIGGLAAVGLAVVLAGLGASDGTGSDSGGWLKLVVGVLFVVLAVRNWRRRPRGDDEPEPPGWMAAIDDFSPVKALGVGVLLSALNPKNLGLTAAAGASVAAAGLSTGQDVLVLAVFVVLASVTVAVPVVVNLALGDRATATLTEMKSWLLANNNVVMAVLLLVIGVKLIGDSLQIL